MNKLKYIAIQIDDGERISILYIYARLVGQIDKCLRNTIDAFSIQQISITHRRNSLKNWQDYFG